jgi:hypothetical protein
MYGNLALFGFSVQRAGEVEMIDVIKLFCMFFGCGLDGK